MDTIRTNWVGWNNEDKCPLCKREGKGIANIWKKGHSRSNGIILESGISYCEECAYTPECESHWKKWWKEKWQKQEQRCEENWEKYGVYTNVGGTYTPVSFYFGYAKTPEGLKPYLQVYPDCPKYKLERDVVAIMHKCDNLGSEDCRKLILELTNNAKVDQALKDIIITRTNQSLDSMDAWKKEQKKCAYCDNMALTYYCKKVWYKEPNEQEETFGVVCETCDKTRPLDDGRK